MDAQCQPKVITRTDPRRIVIEWTDGHESVYPAAHLRKLCPCAACVDELTGVRRHDPATVPADLEHRAVELIGLYAIGIRFADGHDTGIFPFPFLRENDPTAGEGP